MISLITAEAAASLINDRDIVIVGGNGGTGAPETVLDAVERRFLDQGSPRNLTLFHTTGVGAVTEKGLCHLAHPGLIHRVIGGNFGLQLPFMKLIVDNAIEAYNFPQGVMAQMCRAMAAKQPGIITHVGIDTYIDPRREGGRMNARTTENLVEVVHLVGREWLFYHAPPAPRVALIRGTTADEDGYVAMDHEATTREDLSIAQAVHNAGGTVICQIKRLARRGSLHPQMVKIPGFLVDHFVLDTEQQQTYGTRFDASRCGEMPTPISMIVPDPLTGKRVIARRAACELRPGDVVNLGVGISALIPNVAAEEGIEDLITLTVEAGVIGGIPGYAREFGTAVNPRAIIDQPYQFDFYDGGGLSSAFLSFAEIDAEGNVNVTRFGKRYDGAGGFIDITQNAQRLVFSGTLTGGNLDIAVENGDLCIRREGDFRKFVEHVGQISFNGPRAIARGQSVTVVTERAVFQLTGEGMMLREVAPGVRLDEDVLGNLGFMPKIAVDLKPMDPRLFRAGPMGLRNVFAARKERPEKLETNKEGSR